LGTRLPAYLPQRITDDLKYILKSFKDKASQIGVKQFVIQTHFESPMEVTPEAAEAVKKLIEAGWIVTNQHVYTTAASRRGHNLKLREVLNEVGVLPYYTFSVKGYMENYFNFAPNARAVQESIEEKVIGNLSESSIELIKKFPEDAENIIHNINSVRKAENIPFLAVDRNVLNLPGVGKSLSFRVIGITRYGRRVLEFEHDNTRSHSPIIETNEESNNYCKSKSISEYLNQLEEIGDNKEEYTDVYGYSIGETEARMPIYEYPETDISITNEMTNLEISETEFSTAEV
jgi:lysine 2,3-aminomutase